jgi:glutamine amidotransferase
VIGIIDYGLGNVLAFQNVYKRVNVPAEIVRSPEELIGKSHLILPGVGAFDHAMSLFDASGMRSAVDAMVRKRAVPVLGVCVGMQIMADESEEGSRTGLGWIPGRVRKFETDGAPGSLRLPHMGWNDVRPIRDSALFDELRSDAMFYFLHSYRFVPMLTESVIATACYGDEFACAVRQDNVFGVQFHPEKSHHFGAQLLTAFAELG